MESFRLITYIIMQKKKIYKLRGVLFYKRL